LFLIKIFYFNFFPFFWGLSRVVTGCRVRGQRRQRRSDGQRRVPGRHRIHADRKRGLTYRDIAAALNAEGVPTKRRAKWHASTVRYIAANQRYVKGTALKHRCSSNGIADPGV